MFWENDLQQQRAIVCYFWGDKFSMFMYKYTQIDIKSQFH